MMRGNRSSNKLLMSTGMIVLGNISAGENISVPDQTRPNVILIMSDDQGWGETGYYHHPVLKTPNLDAMAANGLRLNRFYAAAPVCSPTRASVLTGRSPERSGVPTHGYAPRLQEKTLPAALQAAGYLTAHFGKWHLNSLQGPGVPIFADDPYSPSVFGFDEWLSSSNYFDRNPLLSRQGDFLAFEGDTSHIIVDKALEFIKSAQDKGCPFFVAIWDASPHRPFIATAQDMEAFEHLQEKDRNHYGELVAFDRSIGVLRRQLRNLNLADNTIIWFCSDNGGLPNIHPDTVGGLRGYKGCVYEGGLRVPAVIEWPAVIRPRVSDYPASTMDIFPTLADVLNLPAGVMLDPVDGESLGPLFCNEICRREKPIPFRFYAEKTGAWVDNEWKLVATEKDIGEFELYNLADDPAELQNLAETKPEILRQMKAVYLRWSQSVDDSIAGLDYPEHHVTQESPPPHEWIDDMRYQPFVDEWVSRPEYKKWLSSDDR